MSETNVLGGLLAPCGLDPVTGFYRDGCCRTGEGDGGLHVVCAQVTDVFLSYSYTRGNDLISPRPEFGFPGLRPGQHWCLCARRWEEARLAGCAPPVVLAGTDVRALDVIALAHLQAHAIDR